MHKPLLIDCARTALLCIDLQEEHRKDPRYLAEGFDAVLANVARLLSAARRHGVAVFHFAYVVDAAAEPLRPHHPVTADGSSAFSQAGDPLTAICPEVAPADGEAVIVKADASAFSRPALDEALRGRGIDTVLVAGVWTEACVAATVRDGVDRGYRVVLVKDACGSGSRAMHETGILNLANRLYGGAVVDTAQACRLVGETAVEAWQVEGAVPLRYTFENASEIYRAL